MKSYWAWARENGRVYVQELQAESWTQAKRLAIKMWPKLSPENIRLQSRTTVPLIRSTDL